MTEAPKKPRKKAAPKVEAAKLDEQSKAPPRSDGETREAVLMAALPMNRSCSGFNICRIRLRLKKCGVPLSRLQS